MPLPKTDFPSVVFVNHKNKGSDASGTWHTFGNTPGKVYVSMDMLQRNFVLQIRNDADASEVEQLVKAMM